MLTRPELTAWIAELRGRLERGELAGLPPVQLQPWFGPGEVEPIARSLLGQVDRWRTYPIEERLIPGAVQMQRHLAEELSLLYERLVDGKPCPEITYRTQR
jgi:hypothetical protein